MTALPHSEHPILGCAESVSAAVEAVREVQPMYMSPTEQRAALVALTQAERRLAELKLRVIAASAESCQAEGSRDVAGWMAASVQTELRDARAEQALAHAIDTRWQRVAAGMAAGAVSADQARVIVRGLEALPAHVGAEIVATAEEQLVEYARTYRPSDLRRLARHILDVVAPEVADAEEAKRLEQEEQRAREECRLTLRPTGEGTTRVTGLLPDSVADRLRNYLESFTSPRKQQGALGGEEDRIPYPRRLGQAFCSLLEHLDPENLPRHGGDATTVMVTIPLEHIQTELATAGYLGGSASAIGDLSATEARRLACTANIIPVVLGGKGEILDLGRSRRLFSPAQRKALALRDKQCREERCTVPARWCEAHHLVPWSLGGTTDLEHGILGCSHHHHMLHDPRFTHEILLNGDIRFHRRT